MIFSWEFFFYLNLELILMQTETETLALAFGEDVRPITIEERKILMHQLYKDKKTKSEA